MSTELSYTTKEYKQILKLSDEYTNEIASINDEMDKAKEIAESIVPFSFDVFKQKYLNKETKGKDVFETFDEIIREKNKTEKYSTAEKYTYSKKSLKRFLKDIDKKEPKTLPFERITEKFLKDYEFHSKKEFGNSIASIAINLRNLRAVYNRGVLNKVIDKANYPFGLKSEGKYSIPSSGKVNKALNKAQIDILKEGEPKTESQEIAKDFWLFSYYSFGMNIKDIVHLKHSDFQENSFSYIRLKTIDTKKEITHKKVFLSDQLKEIIERRKGSSKKYVFNIINEKMDKKQIDLKVKNFVRLINVNIKKFAFECGLDESICTDLSTYSARHSFASISVKNGTNVALLSEILHDGNIKTTQSYLNSFPDEDLIKVSQGL